MCQHAPARPPDAGPPAERRAPCCRRRPPQFNPAKRLSAAEALRHPYVAQFHSPEDEPSCSRVITIPINDNCKYSISDYRREAARVQG
jgi:mitogen-activated protein kinase 15